MYSPDSGIPDRGSFEKACDSGRVRIFLVDGSPITQLGIHAVVESSDSLEIVGTAHDLSCDSDGICRLAPDVVIVNAVSLSQKGLDGITEFAARAVGRRPRMLMIVNGQENAAARHVGAAVDGIILIRARAEEFVAVVKLVAAGYSIAIPERRRTEGKVSLRLEMEDRPATAGRDLAKALTRRELDVLHAVAKGYTNAEIARTMTLSESTVKSHIQNLLAKLGQPNRAGAVALAYEAGVIAGA